MSTLYDALRKSEQQRRLGETPTLGSAPIWQPKPRPRRAPWLTLVAAVTIAALAGGWWLGRQDAAVPADAEVTAASAPAPDAVPADSVPPTVSETATPASTAAPPAAPPARTRIPPTGTIRPAGRTALATPTAPAAPPSSPEDLGMSREIPADLRAQMERGELFVNNPAQLEPLRPTTEVPVVPPEAALPMPLPDPENADVDPARGPVPVPPVAASPPATAPAAAPDARANAPMAATTAAPATARAPAPAASPAPTAGMSELTLPLHFELPLATRQSLPPLKLNMHVYSPDAARRFVILDGVRATEGAAATDGLTVVTIRPDGVVLDFRGTRFVLPRLGR